jgi:hypothetical protein
MRIARRRVAALATFSVALVLSCKDEPTGSGGGVPASMTIVSGDDQDGVVGEELAAPVVVRVLDADDNPVAGQLVNFRVAEGGGSVFAGASITNSDGLAQERWTLGRRTADEQRLEARAVDQSTGQAIVFASFTATPFPGPASTLAKADGDDQAAAAGQNAPEPLVVRALDAFENPVPDVEVSWTVAAGDGTVSPAVGRTDADGRASTTWTLGPRLDAPQRVTATAPTLPAVEFTARASLPGTARIVATPAGEMLGTAGAQLGDSLVAHVLTQGGTPIRGVAVTWTIVEGGGSVNPTMEITDNGGRAAVAWTLGTTAGINRVRASVEGLAPAEWRATGRAGPVARVEVGSGSGQVAAAGSSVSAPLVVVARDEHGNAVGGAEVRWTVSGGGGTVEPAVSTTAANGEATTRWRLGGLLGASQRVTAATGTLPAVEFLATATLPADARLAIVDGDDQSATVGTALAAPLVVRLTTASGSPLVGGTVQWSVLEGAGSFSASSTATDEQGRAATTWTLGTRSGANRARATAGDLGPVSFDATGIADAPASIAVVSGNDQLGRAGRTLEDRLTVVVRDRHGNAVPEAGVSWSTESGGSLAPEAPTTNDAGESRASWTLGGALGIQRASAALATGLSASFSATAVGGVREIARGTWTTCAVTEQSELFCWGSNEAGAFGNGSSDAEKHLSPEPAGGGLRPSTIDLASTACALLDGVAYCWGMNDLGQTGTDGAGAGSCGIACVPTPTPVAGGLRFREISTGRTHTCALTDEGVAYCWGSNRFGQLGDSSRSSASTPRPVRTEMRFSRIRASQDLTCALARDGTAWCWGSAKLGGLGNGARQPIDERCEVRMRGADGEACSTLPVPVSGGRSYTEISTGAWGGCALTSDGAAWCWGDGYGSAPAAIPGGVRFATISHGTFVLCGLDLAGRAFCWGDNRYGALGVGDASLGGASQPTAVAGGLTFSKIESAGHTTCAVSTDGVVYCWGNNMEGQLGDGTLVARDRPVPVLGR